MVWHTDTSQAKPDQDQAAEQNKVGCDLDSMYASFMVSLERIASTAAAVDGDGEGD